jgi:deoxyribodipyrimidine photo-lyase
MIPVFDTAYHNIVQKIKQIDPVAYAHTRNDVRGAVSYLSPYISRGVISTKQVLEFLLGKGYALGQIESFAKELCWRDYFQRLAQVRDVSACIKQAQTSVAHHEMPTAVLHAQTGIEGIDIAIKELYEKGYVHNHCRMYIASVVCNMAQSYWLHPAQWMYYHLLDGDWASNACSWQWVAAANSHKKYFANQENINKYTHSNQSNTFLDLPYEAFEQMAIPACLVATESLVLKTELPAAIPLSVDPQLPTFIYNYYNLDPLWHAQEAGNRILLLEPQFFQQYPISPKCMDFMLSLAKNINHIQVFVGSFEELCQHYALAQIYYKEHPLNMGYRGQEEPRDWIAAAVEGYFPSFFAYWKKVDKHIKTQTHNDH